MKPVLVYRRGAVIPCWERGRWYYPVVWNPNGPPPIPWKFLTEMAQMRQRALEQYARKIEAKFWNLPEPPVTR